MNIIYEKNVKRNLDIRKRENQHNMDQRSVERSRLVHHKLTTSAQHYCNWENTKILFHKEYTKTRKLQRAAWMML